MPSSNIALAASVTLTAISLALMHNAHVSSSPAQVYKRTAPSVVSIKNIGVKRDIFSPKQMREGIQGVGTGFVVSKNTIITNYHVIKDSYAVDVQLSNSKKIRASVISINEEKDVAILGIDEPSVKPLTLCSTEPYIGEPVIAIGNPYDLTNSLSSGVISGIGRNIRTSDGTTQHSVVNILQTDAAINPGNSGGPLISLEHECVVGMNAAMISPGVGLAIPAKDLIKIFDENHIVNILGVELMPDTLAEELDLPGVAVIDVVEGTHASQLGLIGTKRDDYGVPILGDIIVEINGTPIKSSIDIKYIMNHPSNKYEIVIIRNGKKLTMKSI